MIYIKNNKYEQAKEKWNEMVGIEYYGEDGKEYHEDYSTIEADYIWSDDEYEAEQEDYTNFIKWCKENKLLAKRSW